MNLTKREIEVCRLIADGWPIKSTADKLGISVKTVQQHINAIHQKTRAKCIAHVTQFALANGLIRNQYEQTKVG